MSRKDERAALENAYSLPKWIKAFEEAAPAERAAVAERWLRDFVADVGDCPNLTESHVLRYRLTPYIDEVRSLTLAIPTSSDVFTSPWYETNNPVGMWLRRYFNTAVPLCDSTTASPVQGLIRDMWLKPDTDGRLSAMRKLASDRDSTVAMTSAARQVLRHCVWNIAAEVGLPEDVTLAATKLTCWTYGDFSEGEQGTHAIANAVVVLMARCQHGANAYENMLSTAQAKKIMVKYPASCAYLLQWIDEIVNFGERRLLYAGVTGASRVDNLRTWLPGCDSAISMGVEMGLHYEQILSMVSEILTASPEVALPEDVSSELLV